MNRLNITLTDNTEEEHLITYFVIIDAEIIFKDDKGKIHFIDLDRIKKIFIE